MTEFPVNSVEALERRIDDLVMVFVAVAKDQDMTRMERMVELQRLTNRIVLIDGRRERARRARDTAGVLLDAAGVSAYEETGA